MNQKKPLAMDIKNFSFTYANSSSPTIKDLSLPIYKREITALIGPSGSGKSTLLRSLNRIHDLYIGNSYKGEINLYNKNGTKENILEYNQEDQLIKLRQKVGMIFQKPTPFPLSIYENIAYGLKLNKIDNKEELNKRVKKALIDVALWEEVKDRLNKSALELSGGQQQRLCIARAIALQPEILLFDEPTSALDPISTKAIEELIKKLKDKVSIVIVTHNMDQAKRISDYIGFLDAGELIEFNSAQNIFKDPSSPFLKEYIKEKA
ncbi:MAG: phosphate ABC transporter ATP-binding protein [Epsilonproteobacteria bacterium]|nr:phosphate ABC transporter ATP-binding protein [Campylobacterota bacterium]